MLGLAFVENGLISCLFSPQAGKAGEQGGVFWLSLPPAGTCMGRDVHVEYHISFRF